MKQLIKHFLPVLLLFLWLSKDFNCLSGAVEFMNSLPEKQRGRAYVIALNSARSNALTGYYTVIYPDDTIAEKP